VTPPATAQPFDVVVIGGGIQGVGVARDAAGRGLSVLLCERGDLAGATSSASSKLIHGGLRYLEHRELRLVRESLAERERLMAAAPHLVQPMRFVLPHAPWLRSAWVIRLGLFLYDRLGGARSLEASRSVRLDRDPLGAGLSPRFRRGFVYADCRTDDARLVVLNALDARRRGAKVRTRTEVVSARREGGLWRVELRERAPRDDDGAPHTVVARTLVNATGPWARSVLDDVVPSRTRSRIRPVQGSHVVVPRVHDGQHALILQNEDRRVVFVIPFEQHYSLIGTTDRPVEGDPGAASISSEETDYLCAVANRFLATPVSADDVVWSFAGVRPLYDDGTDDPSAVTRDDVVEVENEDGRAPLITLYGGKLTTYRRVAERVLDELAPYFERIGAPWTADATLPGGDVPGRDVGALVRAIGREHPHIRIAIVADLVRRHGSEARAVLGDARRVADLGSELAPGLFEREVRHLVAHEWARTADDVLWRRTKAGLGGDVSPREAVAACVAEALADLGASPTPRPDPGRR